MRFIWLWLFMLCSGAASAAPVDLHKFGALPILHEGRVKPLSSFARFEYQYLTDKTIVGEAEAVAFLARALFDPSEAASEKLFIIRNPRTANTLGLTPFTRYALTDIVGPLTTQDKAIAGWLQRDPGSLSADQRDLIALYDRMVGYTQLLRSLTAFLPLTQALPPSLSRLYDLPEGALSYFDLQRSADRMRADVERLVGRKGTNTDQFTADEKALAYASYQVDEIQAGGAGNVLLRIIPTGWSSAWVSPWEALQTGQSSPDAQSVTALWQGLATAYRAQDEAAFNETIAKLSGRMAARPDVSPTRLSLERFYYMVHPIAVSLLLYALGLCAWFAGRSRLALWLVGTGWAVHFIAITLRVLILARPPVGTLFESILFVGFIAAGGALLCERFVRNGLGTLLAAVAGIVLHVVSIGFAQNGDTLQTLQAVLNTPFWLATHVIVITMGYGACVCTALLAHADLVLRGWRRKTLPPRLLSFGAMIALLLTSIGTLLGGLWADQSWGRFWGWDPKENGALIIVLFLTWLMHGKLSGHIKDVTHSAGLAALTIVVALAWFGVNLLSTGLHSYGFINGIATGLFAYVAVQGALIACCGARRLKKKCAPISSFFWRFRFWPAA